jgi:hypothetical protein
MREAWDKIKKGIRNTLLIAGGALVLYHGASQVKYAAKHIEDEMNQSQEKVQFEKATGIKITGHMEKISSQELFNIAEAIKRAGVTDKELDKIVMESENYFDKTFIGQLSSTVFSGYDGYFNPLTDNILLQKGDYALFIHELMHAKTFAVPKLPQLLRDWSKISVDEKGESLYKTPWNAAFPLAWVYSRLRTSKDSTNGVDLDKLGFVSNYSRRDVIEDIAELCTQITLHPESMWEYLKADDKVAKKINLVFKYGIISQIQKDYMELSAQFKEYADFEDTWNFKGDYYQIRDSLRNSFLDKSEEFIRKHGNSQYTPDAYVLRGLAKAHRVYRGASYSESSEPEFKKALLGPVSSEGYMLALFHLGTLYEAKYGLYGDKNPYAVAKNEYFRRRDNSDFRVLTIGVNDILEQKGAMPKNISE